MSTTKQTSVWDFMICFLLGPFLLIALYFYKFPWPWFQCLGLATGGLLVFLGPVIWWKRRRELQVGAAAQSAIADFLREYSADCYPVDMVKPVICPNCGSGICQVRLEPNEGVIQVRCEPGDHSRLLMDSADYWSESNPRELVCSDCGGKQFNLAVGLTHRESGEVKWVYIGCRCLNCNAIGSPADWKIDYGPTNAMEANI